MSDQEKVNAVPESVVTAQESCQNPVHTVWFRAGLIACREYMARFVEAQDPTIAASIRANWWPTLGDDFGPPRQLDFHEVADGGEEGPWTAKPLTATQEALPFAFWFLEGPEEIKDLLDAHDNPAK